jgi:hypothetical protein
MGGYPRIGLTLSGVFLLAALQGCSSVGAIHQKDAFGSTKTYAVVTVMASEKVGCIGSGGNPCNGGVFGLVNTLTDSNAYSEDATQVLENTYPVAVKVLRASANVKIVEAKGQRAYRDAVADEQPAGMMRPRHTVAKGYKYFSNEKFAKLAKDLKVDGVIVVTLSYSASLSGFQVGGLGGGYQARTTVMVTAVDKDGKTVWFDYAAGQSEDSVSRVAGAVDFPKLRPMFGESTDKATKSLMDNFNEKIKKM